MDMRLPENYVYYWFRTFGMSVSTGATEATQTRHSHTQEMRDKVNFDSDPIHLIRSRDFAISG